MPGLYALQKAMFRKRNTGRKSRCPTDRPASVRKMRGLSGDMPGKVQRRSKNFSGIRYSGLTKQFRKAAMKTITITINGATVSGKQGDTILEAAQSVGIEIPTLCYLKELAPYGGCRLCLVEIIQGKHSHLVASCGYYLKDGLVVETDSPRVKRSRTLVLELLLASMPGSPEIQRHARNYNVTSSRYKRPLNFCVLCGLCVRIAKKLKRPTASDSSAGESKGKSRGSH